MYVNKNDLVLSLGVGLVILSLALSIFSMQSKSNEDEHIVMETITITPDPTIEPSIVPTPIHTEPIQSEPPLATSSVSEPTEDNYSDTIDEIEILIPINSTAHDAGVILQDAGIIPSSDEFIYAIQKDNKDRIVKYGIYYFQPNTPIDDIINIITN